ncbi:hypothetical protein [Listeria rocourtiae]|nr:hypothetical protein [Listeria rocourtiae]EUJ49219.1 hypothetical protein PROCOU_04921 [Listeria rocourtiae FSL F6-920]
MSDKRCWVLIGTTIGVISGIITYVLLHQKKVGSFEVEKETLDLEENNMISEGAMTSITYENRRQALKKIAGLHYLPAEHLHSAVGFFISE